MRLKSVKLYSLKLKWKMKSVLAAKKKADSPKCKQKCEFDELSASRERM